MSTEPKDIKEIFSEALEKQTPEELAVYLDKACGNDAKLRSKVEALLKAHNEAGDFLKVQAVDPKSTPENSPLIEGPGTKIGRYELLELIGEGGMGLVYLAQQQEPVKRKVALKIVKLGMDTRQVVARFEAERQTLALLEHPNIAHVFDAGTTETGRPYFVMEYVKGESITKYCDEQKLNIEQRLELFRQVCEGVHHAHQKGIIHRDIKPSNILVSVHGERAIPKIIDFGIAKAITQPLTGQTSFTKLGQLLGTPEYMSPEQAEMAYQDIDTRSDIYSLGVLLYELLSGAPPFDAKRFHEGGIDHIQHVICEEEPRTPSARLTSLGDKAKVVAESRRTQIITLTRRLEKELEWIPMKAMRKDRTRRYRSASELADDVQNYLTGAPLIAGPESTIYRARKFVRKHAGSVATAVLVAVLIVLGLIVSTALSFRAENARKEEAAARTKAERAEKVAQKQSKLAEKQRRLAIEQRKIAQEQADKYRNLSYIHSVTLADISYRDGNMKRVQELLEMCPEDLRAWEWYRLKYISDQSCTIISGHIGPVYSAAFSPDGTRIVSAWDRNIKVWDSANGNELMDLQGHDKRVMSVAFSPDGKRIISGSKDNTIKIWDVTACVEVMTLRGHQGAVGAWYSPDGKHIVSGSFDSTIKIWEAKSGTELMTIRGHDGPVFSVTWSSDGRRIVSSSKDGTLKVWDVATGDELLTREYEGVISVAFSPDSKWVCSSSGDGKVKVWEVATGDEVMTMHPHKDPVFCVSFSPDSKRIITGSLDHSIKTFDATSGRELMTFLGHEAPVLSISFGPEGQRIVSSSMDGAVRVWNEAIKRDYMTLPSSHHAAFSPDNKRLVSAGMNDNTIKVFDVVTGTEVMTLCGHSGRVWSVAFRPDGERIVSGSFDQTIRIWDATKGVELMILRGHESRVWSVAFSPSGQRVVSGSYDGSVRVWNADKGIELMKLLGHDGNVEAVAYSPDGKHIVSGGWDNTVKVWDAETGKEQMTLVGHDAVVKAVSYSQDGKRIISGSWDNTVKVWDAQTGALTMTLVHKGRVWSVAISSDGRRIVSGSGDGSEDNKMKVWDVDTGTELMTHNIGKIRSITFSPDDRTIAVDSYDSLENIRLLESKLPDEGFEPRSLGDAATKIVDKLYEKYGLYSEVIENLKTDTTLDDSVRKLALQITNARLWEDKGKKQ